jgi:chorismate synthase
MSFEFGENIKITIFGQSHSEAIGAVINGLPAGEEISISKIEEFMARRAPGRNAYSTKRREADRPKILSGLVDGKTCGAPLCAIIENTDVRSSDYADFADVPRPSHADYPAYVKYRGANDIRGGGHFSGRLTAPLCFAGAVCIQILERRGIAVGAHILSIGEERDRPFDPVRVDFAELSALKSKEFPVICESAGERMKQEIARAAQNLDSVGGVVECCALGVPAGVGEPMFGGIENRISHAIFGIPAVKGIEFGSGFGGTRLYGSENNDPYCYEDGKVRTRTNNAGGILGGYSTGMPIIFRVAIKPTPSIGKKQESISLSRRTNVSLEIRGRHDPCIVPRAVPCVEAVCAAVLLDMII